MTGWSLVSHSADTTPHMMCDAIRTVPGMDSLDNSFSCGRQMMSGMIYRRHETL